MMATKCKNLSTTVGASIVIALTATTVQPAAHAATPQRTAASSSSATRSAGAANLSDSQLQQAIRTLAKLPTDLKNANPKTTPNYEARLDAAIRQAEGKPGSTTTYVNWFSCGLALAGVVAQYGVPVGKVVGWLKDGYKIFGGVKGLLAAIKSGAAAAEIGDDAAEILGGILGVGDVASACS